MHAISKRHGPMPMNDNTLLFRGQPSDGRGAVERLSVGRRVNRRRTDLDGKGMARVKPASLSVIVPLFDKAPFVEAAIRSVLDNGRGVQEVLVIDDGSRDNGPDIVMAIGDPRIKLVRKRNGGVSSARNVGLGLATGDWIAFLDADDYWLPGYVDAVQSLIVRHPDCEMVATCYSVRDDSGEAKPVEGDWPFDGKQSTVVGCLYEAMAKGHFCFTGSVVISRDLIMRRGLRFPVGEQFGEDLHLIFGAAESTSVAVDPRPLVVYRDIHDGSRLSRLVTPMPDVPFFHRLDRRLLQARMPAEQRAGATHYLLSHLKGQILRSIEHRCRSRGWKLLGHRLIRSQPKICAYMAVALLLPRTGIQLLRELRNGRRSMPGGRLPLRSFSYSGRRLAIATRSPSSSSRDRSPRCGREPSRREPGQSA